MQEFGLPFSIKESKGALTDMPETLIKLLIKNVN